MLRENIYGLPGCQLPDGGLCNICCIYMRVIAMKKEPGEPCPKQGVVGCSLHDTPEKPAECAVEFHCSDVSNNMKHGLIYSAQKVGLITPAQEMSAKKLWIIS